MKVFDSFRSALQSIIVNKLRSALTMLGVIIGVASVIAMVAVGNGASQTVQQQVLSLGSNLVTVTPGNQNSDTGLRGAGVRGMVTVRLASRARVAGRPGSRQGTRPMPPAGGTRWRSRGCAAAAERP